MGDRRWGCVYRQHDTLVFGHGLVRRTSSLSSESVFELSLLAVIDDRSTPSLRTAELPALLCCTFLERTQLGGEPVSVPGPTVNHDVALQLPFPAR